jgi:tight adherence protein C
MTPALLLAFGGALLALFCLAGWFLLHDIRREERFASRVRVIHGLPAQERPTTNPAELRVALMRAVTGFGQWVLRSGMVPARTRSELETMLSASGLRGPQGVAVFVGCKILLVGALPAAAWVTSRDWAVSSLVHLIVPVGAGVLGLVAPDWLVGRQRKKYQDRLERALPDALDMMVICAQAGLGLGSSVIRVATELAGAFPEIGMELGQTANELQIMTDSRIALANLGSRTGIEGFRRLSTTLIQTVQYGTPLSDALRTLSAELRLDALTKLEERAARLPVMLTMPMICFILPAVFLISGGPAMIQVMQVFGK